MIETPMTFSPDWVSPPGDTVLDLLEEHGWSQAELAKRTGYTTKHISLLINGKAPITDETAIKLERVLGSTARFWLAREARYREGLLRIAERNSLKNEATWLREIPLQDMIKFKWIRAFVDPGEQVAECLCFFGVASVSVWRKEYGEPAAAFRSSGKFAKCSGAVSAWLRQGERRAAAMRTDRFARAAFRATLERLKNLTQEPDSRRFLPELTGLCEKVGVAVVLEPAPSGCPVSGATRWLTPEKALLMLSLRHKTNDHFWFSFFHEAGHLWHHGKRLLFIDGEGELNNQEEREADDFAKDLLIPPRFAKELARLPKTSSEIQALATRLGIAPGIIVGRMQHEGLLPWNSNFNKKLKIKYKWSVDE